MDSAVLSHSSDGIVLAPIIELGIRRSLVTSGGEVVPVLIKPIVAIVLLLSVVTFFSPYFELITDRLSGGRSGPS